MATALTAQLAQIRAKSTHPLDLKEKKRAHSQSLVFDPTVAASQDFDALFHICRDGFDELCRLDNRFEKFARSLFSPDSVQQDRTHLQEATNRQIDNLLESFFVLVTSRLLLQSALKSVEWLVRRFSAHIYNTNVFVLAFLPYYHHSIFTSVLSLIPRDKSSKFLHPYIKTLRCPSYRAIVQGFYYDRQSLSRFNRFVLRCCMSESAFSDQTSLWSSIFSGVIPRLYDACRSSNRKRQDQSERDLLSFLLPLLSDALLVQTPPQFAVAKYQVLGVFVTHAALEDVVLQALAETIVAHWAPPDQAGLLCLSVLSTSQDNHALSKKVVCFLLNLDSLVENLMLLHERFDLSRMVSGLVVGIIQQKQSRHDTRASMTLRRLTNSPLLEGTSTSVIYRSLQEAMSQPLAPNRHATQLRESLEDFAKRLRVNEPSRALSDSGLSGSTRPFEEIKKDAEEATISQDIFSAMVSQIPTRTAHEISFLSHSRSFIFQSLEDTFCKVAHSSELVRQFAELSVLRRSLGMKEPLFISFFARLWCSKLAAPARVTSIRVVTQYLEEGMPADLQFLLPYILQGMLDPSLQVRQCMADLALRFYSFYTQSSHSAESSSPPILGKSDIYGPGDASHSITWLSVDNVRRFLEICILPTFQDDSWGPSQALQVIVDGLKGVHRPHASQSDPLHMKASTRSAIFAHLCAHTLNTPLYAVKTTLLLIVTKVRKVGSQSCSKMLLPLLKATGRLETSEIFRICEKEPINTSETLSVITNIVTPSDYDGIMYMRSLVEGSMTKSSPTILDAFSERLRILFPSLRSDWQVELISSLLNKVSFERRDGRPGSHVEMMHKTLSSLPISSQCLAQTIRQVLGSGSPSESDTSRHKRRRLDSGDVQDGTTSHQRNLDIQTSELTLALEITDKAGIEYDSSLLVLLSQTLADFGSPTQGSIQGTSYLQTLLVDRMLTLARIGERSRSLQLDATKLNTEAVIGCIRATANAQTRNTGLLLLSALSRTLPERVLHSIMPVFTSTGLYNLHHEDEFSLHVVRQTLESIIPPLLESLQTRKSEALSGISNLLAGFAAAFNHMPLQIRTDTYTVLIAKIGQDAYLYILIALLVKAHPRSKRVLQFASEIVSQYSITTQLNFVEKYLGLILDLLKPSPEKALDILSLDSSQGYRPTALSLLTFIPVFLSDASVIGQIQRWLSDVSSKSASRLSLIEDSLDKAIVLSQTSDVGQSDRSHLTQPLDSLLRLLPTPSLVVVLNALLKRTTNQSRLHILLTLQRRLETGKDATSSQESCLRIFVHLLDMVSNATEPKLSVLLLKCIGQIAQLFGRTNVEVIVTCVRPLSDRRCLYSSNNEVRCQSLLCISSVVEAVGEAFMPLLPRISSSCLDAIDDSIAKEKNITLHNAAYVCLCSIFVHLAIAISGSNLDRFIELSGRSACLQLGDQNDSIRGEALSLMSFHVDTGDCLSALSRTWRSAMLEGFPAMVEHINLVKSIVQRLSKSRVSSLQERLEDVMIQILDLRYSQTVSENTRKYADVQIDATEGTINEVMLMLVHKLNDTTFRPLFNRLLEWAFGKTSEITDITSILRRSTLYHFLAAFFGNLKSVVTSYAGYVLTNIAQSLSDIRPVDPDSKLLWRRVIQTLRITLQYDQDDFYQVPSHFSPTSSALLGQIAQVDAALIQEEVIPTVVELALAVDSSEQHKEINSALLQHMRSNKASIRLGAVRCQHALVNRLGHDWLALLPEMLPLISELQEDDDENVENETLRWMAKIEERTGESLAPMLR